MYTNACPVRRSTALLMVLLALLPLRSFASSPTCTQSDLFCGSYTVDDNIHHRHIKLTFLQPLMAQDVSTLPANWSYKVNNATFGVQNAAYAINYDDNKTSYRAQYGNAVVTTYNSTSDPTVRATIYLMPAGYDGPAPIAQGQGWVVADKCGGTSGELQVGQCAIGIVHIRNVSPNRTPSPGPGCDTDCPNPGSFAEPTNFQMTLDLVFALNPNLSKIYGGSNYPNYTNSLITIPLIPGQVLTMTFQCWNPDCCT